jgi:curved DNA-binding protein CbpA
MQGDDPYDVLGVAKNASEDEIKEAYRDKVKQYHPDVSDVPGAERKFRRVREAYDVLLSGDADGSHDANMGEGTSEYGTGTDSGPKTGRSDRTRRERAGNGPGSSGEDEERGFKIMETYEDGWKLAVCSEGAHVGEWFVYRDGTGIGTRYLNLDGETSDERVYFGTRKQAERGHENHSRTESRERRNPGAGKREGRSSGGRRRTGPRKGRPNPGETGGEEVRGEEVGGFDSLWTLYRSEDDQQGWAVVSETFGSPYYLNGTGEQQRQEYWFDSRSDAEAAYEAYMSGAEDVGGPSRNLTGGAGTRDDGRERRREESARKVKRETEGRRPPVSALGTVLEAIGREGMRLTRKRPSSLKAVSSLTDKLPSAVRGLLTFIGFSVVVYVFLRLLLSLIAAP